MSNVLTASGYFFGRFYMFAVQNVFIGPPFHYPRMNRKDGPGDPGHLICLRLLGSERMRQAAVATLASSSASATLKKQSVEKSPGPEDPSEPNSPLIVPKLTSICLSDEPRQSLRSCSPQTLTLRTAPCFHRPSDACRVGDSDRGGSNADLT